MDDLPVKDALPSLKAALLVNNRAVLVAPPGAGKTTLVPLALLDEPWAGDGRIILLEPRRIAARSAARRMAALLGEDVGETVGYSVRMDSKQTARTRILVATEGILARMVIEDPTLEGISAILFDEFHERALDADFGLALTLDAQEALRPDLRVLVMSATLDGARVSNLLGTKPQMSAPVIESSGRSFPVELRHLDRDPAEHIETAMANAISGMLAQTDGNILAFLPGQREIARTADRLSEILPGAWTSSLDIVPLHGGLEGAAQDAAIRSGDPGRRRIVLATSIAETSVTIDGVTVVVDSGLSRLPHYEPQTGLTRLETVRVSRASADQRAGRAGRTAPGIALRLWRKEQTAALPAYTPPEILDADLSGLLLDCAAFGITDPTQLKFLDTPPAPALKEARALLETLGALDASGSLTEVGRAMRHVALPARLAHMVSVAAASGEALHAAQIAVLLTERGLGGTSVNLEERLTRFRTEKSPRARAAQALATRIARTAESHAKPKGGNNKASSGALLLNAWPDRVARARGEYGSFVLANGRGARLDPIEKLAGEPWLVVADLQGQARNARITAACTVREDEILSSLASRIEEHRDVTFDVEKGVLRQRRRSSLGAITLADAPLPAPDGATANAGLIDAIRRHSLSILAWSRDAEALRARLAFLHETNPAHWPDMSDAALIERLEDWLLPFMHGKASISSITPHELIEGLRSLLPYDRQRQIDVMVPSHFTAPTGSKVPIRYENGEAVLAIRVQELFGLETHPTVGDKIPLTLELLSPAHRPIQKTRDLPGFWQGSWADVRADMRGRYPKHVWPEDPANAAPTSRAKPRGT